VKATITDAADRASRARRWLSAGQHGIGGRLLGAIAAGVLGGVGTILQMGLIAWLVHLVVVAQAGAQELLWPAFALAGAMLLRATGQVLQDHLGTSASTLVRQQVRQRLVLAWSVLGPVRLAGRSSATLANLFVEQVEALDGYYARYLPQVALSLLIPLLIAIVAWQLDWLATLFLLLAAPLIPLFMALVGMGAEKLSQAHVLEAGRLAGHFLDRVRAITSLQLFGQVPATIAGVGKAAQGYREVTMRTLRIAFLSSAVLEFFASVAIAVVAMYVGFGLLGYIEYGPSSELSLFTGLFVLLLAPEFFQPLRSLAQHYHDRAAALAAADSLAALEAEAAGVAQASAVYINRSAGASRSSVVPTRALVTDPAGVRVAGLSLAYAGRGVVLRDVSLALEPGSTLVVTGPSGSGKSSLLHCLAGFIQPEAGEIDLGGLPSGSVAVGWMGQRPLLIQGSWRENLLLTAPGASTPAMIDALHRVGLGQVLARLPAGLDTLLGEGGRGLSGGQAQRLALARLWLCDAPLLLLDEPTASLDAESEAEVIDALKGLARSGRTLIIATHHPALMTLGDQRLELSCPEVMGEGAGHG
jgi:ATP-binding cassette, subfamily C, bacterial CydD